ncbi:MAG: hypothetical protein IKR82_06890 [Bacteroidales bacterium]|nr:hypothetical protein [Bacteroidales bacterium]
MSLNESAYEVNPVAESILDKFLKTVLVICIIIGVIGIFAAIIAATVESQSAFLWLIPVAILFVIMAGVFWAIGKVLINISRNLYNINDSLRANGKQLGEKPVVAKKVEKQAETKSSLEKKEGEKFAVGQLVIIKEDERQFRVTSTFRKEDGTVSYYSDRLNKFFDEAELEDFDAYWAARKG